MPASSVVEALDVIEHDRSCFVSHAVFSSSLQDRVRQVVTTRQTGENSARAAKLLKEMGFENVSYMEGGMEARKAAGFATS